MHETATTLFIHPYTLGFVEHDEYYADDNSSCDQGAGLGSRMEISGCQSIRLSVSLGSLIAVGQRNEIVAYSCSAGKIGWCLCCWAFGRTYACAWM